MVECIKNSNFTNVSRPLEVHLTSWSTEMILINLIKRAYYPIYPNESEYNDGVLQNIMYHGGDPDCLPGRVHRTPNSSF